MMIKRWQLKSLSRVSFLKTRQTSSLEKIRLTSTASTKQQQQWLQQHQQENSLSNCVNNLINHRQRSRARRATF